MIVLHVTTFVADDIQQLRLAQVIDQRRVEDDVGVVGGPERVGIQGSDVR